VNFRVEGAAGGRANRNAPGAPASPEDAADLLQYANERIR